MLIDFTKGLTVKAAWLERQKLFVSLEVMGLGPFQAALIG